ncbi:hypothetical protein [Rubinisphaera sp.]|uniref:hypothetical protein n=1 Tax=Rubinisphaera sp. TaxID=2024857 RepID=UPI000C100BCA|nr:hypothetical protein [Rubinisphaera sp.]MBV11652.1 hypothetical protein [Rubinisphaera sp.]HCS54859.1 hypothetical protein [Planctomycetaceae bacterium]
MAYDPQTVHQASRQIEHSVRQLTGGLIRGLQISSDQDRVIMTGATDLYYHKQLATRAAMDALDGRQFNNEIVVSRQVN